MHRKNLSRVKGSGSAREGGPTGSYDLSEAILRKTLAKLAPNAVRQKRSITAGTREHNVPAAEADDDNQADAGFHLHPAVRVTIWIILLAVVVAVVAAAVYLHVNRDTNPPNTPKPAGVAPASPAQPPAAPAKRPGS